MTTINSAIITRDRLLALSTNPLDTARRDIASSLLGSEWLHSSTIERLINAQAQWWAVEIAQRVLVQQEEHGASEEEAVAAVERELVRCLAMESLGGSTSAVDNVQQAAKVRALQSLLVLYFDIS